MEAMLSKIATRDIKHHKFAYFSSSTWANGVTKKIANWLEHTHMKLVTDPIEMKQSFKEENMEDVRALSKAMAEAIKK